MGVLLSNARQFSWFRYTDTITSLKGALPLLFGVGLSIYELVLSRTQAMNFLIRCLLVAELLLASAVRHQALRTKVLKVSKCPGAPPEVF